MRRRYDRFIMADIHFLFCVFYFHYNGILVAGITACMNFERMHVGRRQVMNVY